MATLASVWMNSGEVGWEKRSRMDLSLSVAGVGVGFSGRAAGALGEGTNSKSWDSFDGSVDILNDCDVMCSLLLLLRIEGCTDSKY